MIKGVIFDMDGLLIDSEIVCYRGYDHYFQKRFNQPISLEEYGKLFAGRSMIAGVNNALEYYAIDFDTDKAIEEIKQDNIVTSKEKIPLKPGAKELLVYLHDHHYKIAMATSSHLDRVHALLDDYDILKYFDELVSSSQVKRGKPYPDVFLKACEVLEISPAEGLVLEDADSGIQAAHDGGIKVINIPDLRQPAHPEYCEAVLKSLDLVTDYLAKQA